MVRPSEISLLNIFSAFAGCTRTPWTIEHGCAGGTELLRGKIKSFRDGAFTMLLQPGEVQGYNFNRMAVEFTMVNQGKEVPCSIRPGDGRSRR